MNTETRAWELFKLYVVDHYNRDDGTSYHELAAEAIAGAMVFEEALNQFSTARVRENTPAPMLSTPVHAPERCRCCTSPYVGVECPNCGTKR